MRFAMKCRENVFKYKCVVPMVTDYYNNGVWILNMLMLTVRYLSIHCGSPPNSRFQYSQCSCALCYVQIYSIQRTHFDGVNKKCLTSMRIVVVVFFYSFFCSYYCLSCTWVHTFIYFTIHTIYSFLHTRTHLPRKETTK